MGIYSSSSEPEPEEIKEEVRIIFLLCLGNCISKINPVKGMIISSI